MSSTYTKVGLSVIFIIAIIAYALWRSGGSSAVVATSQDTTSGQVAQLPQPSATAPAPTQTSMMPQRPAMMGAYRNGSYTGKVVDAFYGLVQVKAVVKNGRLSDVQFLQYPSDREHSQELSAMAMPILTQEAIVAQNAHVDTVSGATQTSEAFKSSLASALAQA